MPEKIHEVFPVLIRVTLYERTITELAKRGAKMTLKKILLAAALCASATLLQAADFYVVVPVQGKEAPKGTPDGPQLSAAKLDFGARQRGDIGLPRVLKLTNPGTRPLAIARINIPESGAAVGYSLQHDCTVLEPAQSCTGYVYYRPAVSGVHTSTITIDHDGLRRSSQVALAGSAQDPSAKLAVAEFGNVNVGSAKDKVAVLTNTGLGNISVGAPLVTGSGYKLMSTDCPSPLAPAESCNITTRLTAATTGELPGQLSITTGAGGLSANLVGRGVSSDLQITSGPVASFGSVAVGASVASSTITLKNTGNIPAEGLALQVTDPTDYAIESSTCSSVLPAGGTCSFAVRFSPKSAGAQLADVQALVGDKVSASSPLSGVGTSAAVFLTASTQTSVILVGIVESQYYTVTNSSTSPVTIMSKSLSHPEAALVYELGGGTNECQATVPAKSSCRINFTLQSADVFATKQLTLTLNTSAGKITSNAMGVLASWAKLTTTPTSPAFDFGNVAIGNSVTSVKVTVKNTATAINVSDASYTVPEGFQVVNSSCGSTSIRNTTCELYLKFTPTAAKAYSGTFTMTTRTQYVGAGGTPQPYVLSIPLSGVGTVPAALGWQGGQLDVVEVGVARLIPLTLYNPGSSAVSLGPVTLTGNTTEFTLSGTTCAASLAANSSCTATVKFTATATGARAVATVNVVSSGATVSKALTATAGTATLTSTPTALAFPKKYAAGTGIQDAFTDLLVTVKNTGTAAAENLQGSVAYNGSALGFTFQYNACVNRLNAGSSCTLYVRAAGSIVGDHSGTVTFKSASGQVSIPFTFSIVPMDIGVVTSVPVQDTAVGKGTISTYTISTATAGKVVVDVPTITGNTAEYSLAAGSNCSGILQLNSSCVINVLFTPTSTGARPQGTLNVKVGGVMRTVSLIGAGLAP